MFNSLFQCGYETNKDTVSVIIRSFMFHSRPGSWYGYDPNKYRYNNMILFTRFY